MLPGIHAACRIMEEKQPEPLLAFSAALLLFTLGSCAKHHELVLGTPEQPSLAALSSLDWLSRG